MMGEVRNAYKILVGNLLENGQLQDQWGLRRWKDNMKMDGTKMGWAVKI
jgi:hypothetical protein